MTLDEAEVQAAIKQKVVEIAAMLGDDASELRTDEIIPATGLIDSAGLLELLAWFESHYSFTIPPEDLTIDNLGSIADMTQYLRRRKGLA